VNAAKVIAVLVFAKLYCQTTKYTDNRQDIVTNHKCLILKSFTCGPPPAYPNLAPVDWLKLIFNRISTYPQPAKFPRSFERISRFGLVGVAEGTGRLVCEVVALGPNPTLIGMSKKALGKGV